MDYQNFPRLLNSREEALPNGSENTSIPTLPPIRQRADDILDGDGDVFLTEVSARDMEEGQDNSTLTALQERLRKQVQKDIKKKLLSSKEYMANIKNPAVWNKGRLDQLAKPHKVADDDPQIELLYIEDPIEFAKAKTKQLVEKRVAKEKLQKEEKQDKQFVQEQLRNFKNYKKKLKEDELLETRKKEKEDREYGRRLATFVADRQQEAIVQYRAKMEKKRKTAAELHSKNVTGFFNT
uniref:Uncharacterized protein n=1 Tax=Polytomella parva TaxID=51329 RepID=A0A7S0VCL1_9CHLO|mmetsp:Transcript_29626/g.54338  ORF Transcript_29626/g.54338 Transcript_29626/m.54338 type:complete len:238 (+) Transcript_29626:57-770(+)